MGLWAKGFERSKENIPRLEDKNELEDLRDLFGWDNYTSKLDTLKEIADFVGWDNGDDNCKYTLDNIYPQNTFKPHLFKLNVDSDISWI